MMEDNLDSLIARLQTEEGREFAITRLVDLDKSVKPEHLAIARIYRKKNYARQAMEVNVVPESRISARLKQIEKLKKAGKYNDAAYLLRQMDDKASAELCYEQAGNFNDAARMADMSGRYEQASLYRKLGDMLQL